MKTQDQTRPQPMAGHTPGPWQVTHLRRGTDYVNAFRVSGPADGRAECEPLFETAFPHNDHNEANARLIASAPRLLQENAELREALAGLFRECAMIHKYAGEICNQKAADAAEARARAALAKATGK